MNAWRYLYHRMFACPLRDTLTASGFDYNLDVELYQLEQAEYLRTGIWRAVRSAIGQGRELP